MRNISSKPLVDISSVEVFDIESHKADDGGVLCVVGDGSLPIAVRRIFYVYGITTVERRGMHAHYKTGQVLICIHGKIEVLCYDGESWRSDIIDSPNKALHIPAGLWDEQIYQPGSILLCLASTLYDQSDYIIDMGEFVALKRGGNL